MGTFVPNWERNVCVCVWVVFSGLAIRSLVVGLGFWGRGLKVDFEGFAGEKRGALQARHELDVSEDNLLLRMDSTANTCIPHDLEASQILGSPCQWGNASCKRQERISSASRRHVAAVPDAGRWATGRLLTPEIFVQRRT